MSDRWVSDRDAPCFSLACPACAARPREGCTYAARHEHNGWVHIARLPDPPPISLGLAKTEDDGALEAINSTTGGGNG